MFKYSAADVCKNIPQIVNGTRKGDSKVIGSVIRYKCFARLRFDDGLSTRNITCTNLTLWSQEVTDCKGINQC